MLLQNKDMTGMFSGMFKHLKIRITNRCNLKCRHCYVPTEDYPKENDVLNNFEWVDRLTKSKRIVCVHLMGGEPTLFPEALKQCVDICKKNHKKSGIFTNGLKLMDKDFREYVNKEVKPEIIIVSFNKYLEEQVDQVEVVNTLADFYRREPNIMFGSTAMIDSSNMKAFEHFVNAGGWPPYDPTYFTEIENKLKFDYWKFQLPLCAGGRMRTDDPDVPRMIWPNRTLACDFSVVLRPDGILQADCGCGKLEKTKLGHIDDFKADPIEDIHSRLEMKIIRTSEKLNGYYEYCQRHDEIRCLKSYPKWTH